MSSRQSPPHVPALASRYPKEAFALLLADVEPTPPDQWPQPIEKCVCGLHLDCPDDWHWGADLPCVCTPDCALEAES